MKEKTVEAEDYKSKYNKMSSLTIKDLEHKINQLIDELS